MGSTARPSLKKRGLEGVQREDEEGKGEKGREGKKTHFLKMSDHKVI